MRPRFIFIFSDRPGPTTESSAAAGDGFLLKFLFLWKVEEEKVGGRRSRSPSDIGKAHHRAYPKVSNPESRTFHACVFSLFDSLERNPAIA